MDHITAVLLPAWKLGHTFPFKPSVWERGQCLISEITKATNTVTALLVLTITFWISGLSLSGQFYKWETWSTENLCKLLRPQTGAIWLQRPPLTHHGTLPGHELGQLQAEMESEGLPARLLSPALVDPWPTDPCPTQMTGWGEELATQAVVQGGAELAFKAFVHTQPLSLLLSSLLFLKHTKRVHSWVFEPAVSSTCITLLLDLWMCPWVICIT